MRITYRENSNLVYWEQRLKNLPIDAEAGNVDRYPLKYALKTLSLSGPGRILDAGCGPGRVIRHLHAQGHDVEGFDFVADVIEKLKQSYPELKVSVGDVTDMEYPDSAFASVMGFGLYHNLLPQLQERALLETRRILAPGGILCASFRADNITTRISDWLRSREKPRESSIGKREFHKINLTATEIGNLLQKCGFRLLELEPVENMPVLYKFRWFRHSRHREFNEPLGRQEGYRLNKPADLAQNILKAVFPTQMCNIFVAYAQRS
jgi:SAM-dependent methyltransferase